MAVKQTHAKAPKIKIVPGGTLNAIALSDAEEGELYYNTATSGIQLRTSEGWVTFSQD